MHLFSSKNKAPAESSTAFAAPVQQSIPQPQAPKLHTPRRFGLHQVYPDPDHPKQGKEQDFDIVAIHGLNAESPKTWTAWKKDGDPNSRDIHWLKDKNMLPFFLPNARIFTYDWNAGTENNAATDILLGHADGLLHRLRIERDTANHPFRISSRKSLTDTQDQNTNRPIIWVASCYGGLLLAKALQRASEGNSLYYDILYSTAGIVFLGTPFQGSDKGFYSAAEARLAVALAAGAETSDGLIKYIRDDATRGGRGELDDVTDISGLVKHINDLPKGFAKLLDENGRAVLVQRYSACLQGFPGRSLHVRHSMLSKFASPDDDSFKQIAFGLRGFSQGARDILKNKSTHPQNPLNEDTSSIADWLSTIDYSAEQNQKFSSHQSGTNEWFLKSKEFDQWVQNSHKTLYCPGIPGSGKTTLISVVIDNLLQRFQNNNDICVAYLYCDAKWENERSVEDLLLSFLAQLIKRRFAVPKIVKSLVDDHKKKSSRPKFSEISEVLEHVITTFSRVFFIVDALDELQPDCRKRLLSVLFAILEAKSLSFLATSRFSALAHDQFKASGPILEIRARNADIQAYLRGHIYQLPDFVQENRQLQQEIITQLSRAASGMFLLSTIYLDSLKDKVTLKAMRAGLQRFQASNASSERKDGLEKLNKAYMEIVKRIGKQKPGLQKLAKKVLSWLTFARRPISIGEPRYALAVEDKSTDLDDDNFVGTSLIISVCAGLATIEERSGFVLVPWRTLPVREQGTSIREWPSPFTNRLVRSRTDGL